MPETIRLRRVPSAPPERVHRAFLDDDARAKWLPPDGFTGKVGTELSIVQAGIPDVIPADACYLGWQQSLTLLAGLVEPDIPG